MEGGDGQRKHNENVQILKWKEHGHGTLGKKKKNMVSGRKRPCALSLQPCSLYKQEGAKAESRGQEGQQDKKPGVQTRQRRCGGNLQACNMSVLCIHLKIYSSEQSF